MPSPLCIGEFRDEKKNFNINDNNIVNIYIKS